MMTEMNPLLVKCDIAGGPYSQLMQKDAGAYSQLLNEKTILFPSPLPESALETAHTGGDIKLLKNSF